ncbi:succinylglutamate desuccinylase [Croceivirga lutea]|uniref:succinylglutamate desuccinylase/aspartoacylase family protein n=1 Tax=Croceivirga lutea TaxID=1775167 RepID=UPI00163B0252|nr:succinylglutamate desuccinylase/aspartoacylase family protein [Croceivirga lutea]GGG39438.1 succinylglutamate desuccinylase [Croceivirga lutea]
MHLENENKFIEINNEIVKPGEAKQLRIPISRLPTGTLIDIPVHVFNSSKPGPTILLQAGLHGDEINGVETLRRMLEAEEFNIKRGAVIVVPVLNIFGFIHFSRDVPDGKDVNRSFSGSKNGSLASRIAYHYTQEILPQVDFGIDLHTGGGQRSNYPQVRYTKDDAFSKELAMIFNAPFSFASKLISGSFRKVSFSKGKSMIVYEAGESMRFDENSIMLGCIGIRNVLTHFNMIELSSTKKIYTKQLSSTRWLRAPRAGMFIPKIENGSAIKKGTLLGVVADTVAKKSKEIKSPINGYIFCINNQAVVNQGDALFHVGT